VSADRYRINQLIRLPPPLASVKSLSYPLYMITERINHSDIDSRHANDFINAWYNEVAKRGEIYATNAEILAKETALDLLSKGAGEIVYGRKKDDLLRVNDKGLIPENKKLFFKAVVGYAYLWGIALSVEISEQLPTGAKIEYIADDLCPHKDRQVTQEFQWKYRKRSDDEEIEKEAEADTQDEETAEVEPCPAGEVIE